MIPGSRASDARTAARVYLYLAIFLGSVPKIVDFYNTTPLQYTFGWLRAAAYILALVAVVPCLSRNSASWKVAWVWLCVQVTVVVLLGIFTVIHMQAILWSTVPDLTEVSWVHRAMYVVEAALAIWAVVVVFNIAKYSLITMEQFIGTALTLSAVVFMGVADSSRLTPAWQNAFLYAGFYGAALVMFEIPTLVSQLYRLRKPKGLANPAIR